MSNFKLKSQNNQVNMHTIIVGGTRGSGKEYARMLANSERQVSILGRKAITEHKLVHEKIDSYSVDITDHEKTKNILSTCQERRGSWTSLVFFQKFRDDGDTWLGEWQVSLDATKVIVDHAVSLAHEHSIPRSIVVIGSVAGRMIINTQPIGYHAAKAALEQMVKFWAVHLGKLGIRVNMVSPHAVLKEESADFYLNYAKLMDLYKKIIPLGRMGTAKEVVNVVDFLCSSQASYITGQNIIVDGGITLPMQEDPIRALLGMEK